MSAYWRFRSIGLSRSEILCPGIGPSTLSVFNLLDLLVVLVPAGAILTIYSSPDQAPQMQLLMALNILPITVLFYRMAIFWTPFKVM